MSDRWYYQHEGRTQGPVTAEELRQLAAEGRLDPDDLIWPEDQDQRRAVPARAAVEFPDGAEDADEWFADVAPLGETHPRTTAAQTPEPAAEGEEDLFAWDTDAVAEDDDLIVEEVVEAELVEEAAPSAPSSCRLTLGAATTRGRVRDRNEDSLLVQHCAWGNLGRRRDLALVVVADGMGGYQAGDRASGLVIRAMAGTLAPLLAKALSEQGTEPEPATLAEALDGGLHEANRAVLQAARDNPACKGMGSTAVALLIWDSRAYVSLVGDCRVYHWRAGRLAQVTRDQTLVARMVELGQLTPEEATTHPKRNEVTQAVGKFSRIEPARYELALSPSDWLIASCDGLYAHVDDTMLAEAVGKAGPSPAALAQQLVEMANHGGGSDNCTVVAVRCG